MTDPDTAPAEERPVTVAGSREAFRERYGRELPPVVPVRPFTRNSTRWRPGTSTPRSPR